MSGGRTGGQRGRRGFSLVEWVLVVVIIGAMAAMALPRFSGSIALQRVDGAARRVAADLLLAREHAITTSQTVELRFRGDLTGYAIVGMVDPRRADRPYEVEVADELNGVDLSSVDFGGDRSVFFDLYGVPDSAGTLRLQADSHRRDIALDAATGQVVISE